MRETKNVLSAKSVVYVQEELAPQILSGPKKVNERLFVDSVFAPDAS
jgi:hypothetical protein